MNENKSYVVVSYYGEYDDKSEIIEKVFLNKSKAEDYVKELEAKHMSDSKFPLVFNEDDFLQDYIAAEYDIEEEHPEINDENPYDYTDTENFKKWSDELDRKYFEWLYEIFVRNDKYKNLSYEDFRKVDRYQSYKYSMFNDYRGSFIKDVTIDLN